MFPLHSFSAHDQLAPSDLWEHLTLIHGLTVSDLNQLTTAVSTGQLKRHRQRADTTDYTEEEERAELVHDRLHRHDGEHFTLLRDVERYPHAIVPAGTSGILTRYENSLVTLDLDEHVEGLEEWNNEVHWYPEDSTDGDARTAFRMDVDGE